MHFPPQIDPSQCFFFSKWYSPYLHHTVSAQAAVIYDLHQWSLKQDSSLESVEKIKLLLKDLLLSKIQVLSFTRLYI